MSRDRRYPWRSAAELKFSPEGKHVPVFPRECPLLVRFYRFPAALACAPNYHDYLEITFVEAGSGRLYVENTSYAAGQGDAFVLSNAECHYVEARGAAGLDLISIYFLGDLVCNPGLAGVALGYLRVFLDRGADYSHKIAAGTPESRAVRSTIDTLYSQLVDRRPFWELAARNAVLELLLRLVRYYDAGGQLRTARRRSKTQFGHLKAVFDYLRVHYTDKIILDDVARRAKMNRYHFCRTFRRYTGMPLTEFVHRLRVQRAQKLLRATDMTITQVALEVGFDSHSHFDRVFKRYAHMTPSRFLAEQVRPRD